MTVCTQENPWDTFLELVQQEISKIEYINWIKPIGFRTFDAGKLTLSVPNVFVQNYLVENYADTLAKLLNTDEKKPLPIEFLLAKAYLKDNEADDKFEISNVVLTNSSTDPGIAAELSSLTA